VALALGEELGGIIAIAPSPQAADHAMSLFTDAFNAASASEGSRAGEAATITTRAANRRPI
jgi:hypothetical protein